MQDQMSESTSLQGPRGRQGHAPPPSPGPAGVQLRRVAEHSHRTAGFHSRAGWLVAPHTGRASEYTATDFDPWPRATVLFSSTQSSAEVLVRPQVLILQTEHRKKNEKYLISNFLC